MSFVHLHCHSHYSLLDGLPKINDLIEHARALGMEALALTDHGVMYGSLEFYEKAKAAGLKPIVGMEGYLAPGSRFDRKANEKPFHQILLARNAAGYRNLMKLSSLAHLEGFYYKPRFDKEILARHAEGLIATSGCLQGEIPQLIMAGQLDKAGTAIKEYQSLFGPDNFYLEVQDHPEIPEQIKLNAVIFSLAREYKVPVVATNDSHYIAPADSEAQDILVCVSTGKTVTEEKRLRMTGVDLSFKSEATMRQAFTDHPEAIEETVRLAARCELELETGKFHFPVFALPAGKSADEYLRDLTALGLAKKYESVSPEYQTRVDYELSVIKAKGFAAYFLIVADYTNWARSQGIISTTRGSAAGSLVSHAIGITTVNPMIFQLPFERFLNPFRPSAPDIDMDFADDRRDDVIAYVSGRYGADKVAQICTFGTMMARGSVRDVGRALGYPYSFCDRISKLIPPGKQGFPMTISRALKETPELKQLYDTDLQVRRLLDIARKVEGSARHPSVHAAGVVIAPSALTDFTPVQRETGGDKVITQYDMHACESAGLVKMDFLGIRNLSILGLAVKIIKKTKAIDIDIDNLPFEDKTTFALLARGQTIGLFQLGGEGMTRYLVELKPTKITDIMAMVALFRPGPMDSIPEFISRKHNPKLTTYIDDRLRHILKDSYGIITYQEDVLYIAIEIAGYNWAEADKLRKAMGKKIPAEMAKQKDKFVTGCKTHGQLDPDKANQLWKLIEPFAAYGFGKAHAASYGVVAYQTAYLKAHFPAEFMAAVMTAESGDIAKVAEAVAECQALGIKVLPPDINESFATFTVVDDRTIRFGLSAIKNIGEHIVEAIISERKRGGLFVDIMDFLARVNDKDLNRKSLESFIRSGSLDRFALRHTLHGNIEMLLAFARETREAKITQQSSLFGSAGGGRRILQLTARPAKAAEILQWEKELLGLYISGHPLKQYQARLARGQSPIDSIRQSNLKVRIAGLITAVKPITTKKGDAMAFVTLEDLTGTIEVIVFPKLYATSRALWLADSLVAVSGRSEERAEKFQILAEKVEPLVESNKNNYQSLEIYLPPDTPTPNLARLKELLYNYQGQTPVVLRVNGNKTVRLPIKVMTDLELMNKLKDLVGQNNIKQSLV